VGAVMYSCAKYRPELGFSKNKQIFNETVRIFFEYLQELLEASCLWIFFWGVFSSSLAHFPVVHEHFDI